MDSTIETTDDLDACKVLIVDNQAAISGLLRILLRQWPAFEAVGECRSTEEALCFCAQSTPDLIIMDAALDGLAPPQFIRALKEVAPNARLLVFSRWDHPDFSRTFMAAGVHGFIFKQDSLEILQRAVCTLAGGGMYFSPAIEESRRPEQPTLTEREIAALRLIAEGHSTKEMASVLEISVKTAEKYRERIMRKLDLHDAVQLTHFAIRRGLVTP
jgi:DNA-binding NarL/FixJ family response regulator